MGLKQVILGQSAINSGFAFFSPRGNDGNPAHASVEWPWPVAATINNLALHLRDTPGVSTSLNLIVNNVASSLIATVNNGSFDAQDTTHSVSIAAGDLVCFQRSGNSWVDGHNASWSFTSDAGDGVTSVYGFCRWDGSPFGTGAFTCFNGERGAAFGGSGSIVPIAGNITSLWMVDRDAPGTGKSRTFALELNGVVQDGSGGTVDTRFTLSNAATSGHSTFSLPIAAGDIIRLYVTESGSPAATAGAGSISFAATVPGHYFMPCKTVGGPSNTVTNYVALDGNASVIGPSATEDLVWAVGPAVDEFDIDTIYAVIGAPSGSWTYTLRKGGADPAGGPSLTISGASTSGHATGSLIAYTSIADYLDLKSVPSGTPTNAGFVFSLTKADPTSVPIDPSVETRAPTGVRRTQATLRGRVNANGWPTTYGYFEWGTASNTYTHTTTPVLIGTGIESGGWVPISAVITGLTPGTTYYYRAVGDNADGIFEGEEFSFVTSDEPVFTDSSTSYPMGMFAFIDRTDGPHVFAETYLPDPGPFRYGGAGYEGGYKKPTILEFQPAMHSISDYRGQTVHSTFGARFDDKDYFWRDLLVDPDTDDGMGGNIPGKSYLKNCPVYEKIIGDEDRRLLKQWRFIANGFVDGYSALPDIQFVVQCTDWMKNSFSRQNKSQNQWQQLITTDLFANADGTVTNTDGIVIRVNAVGKAVPGPLYGKLSDEDEDTPRGAYSPLWVGPQDIGGNTYQVALICCNVVADLTGGFLNDVAVDLTSDADWLTFKNVAAWAGAGFTDPWVTIGSKRYTIAYLKGDAGDYLAGIKTPPAGAAGVTFNVWGAEDVGDQSGVLIENPLYMRKHFAVNYLASVASGGPTGQDGDWLVGSPTFVIAPGDPYVDEDSYDAVAQFVNDRLASLPDNRAYTCAGCHGANGELVGAEEALARMRNSDYTEDYFSPQGSLTATLEPAVPPAGLVLLRSVLQIKDKSTKIPEQIDSQFWTRIPINHTKDYTGKRTQTGWYNRDLETGAYLTFDVNRDQVFNTTGETNFRQSMPGPTFDMHFGWAFSDWGRSTVVDSAVRRLNSYTRPRRDATVTVPLSATIILPGDVIKIDSEEGVGVSGWHGHHLRVKSTSTRITDGEVDLNCYDIGVVWGGAFM